MKTSAVIKYFSDRGRLDALGFRKARPAIAHILGISRQAVHKWGKYPPPNAQLRLEKATEGQLQVEKDLLPPIVK